MLQIYKRGSIFFIGTFIYVTAFTPSLLPAQAVVDVMDRHDNISMFVEAIRQADIEQKLNSGGPYTIFAPSNTALQNMEDQLSRSNSAALQRFVMNHVLTGMATKRQILAMSRAPTLGGLTLKMAMQNDQITVNDIPFVNFNIRAQNGVIHVINGTLED